MQVAKQARAANKESGIEEPSARRFYGWTNVWLLFLILFIASGFVYYAYSIIFPAMVLELGWNRGSASLGQSLALISMGLSYPLTAWLIARIGVRYTLSAGLGVMIVGLVLVAFFVTQVWQWILIWGLIVGLSFALSGPLCAQTAMMHWFRLRRATSLGMLMTGAAVGGFLAQPVLVAIMDRFGGWQSAWLASAALVVLALIIAQFIINTPQEIGQHPDGIDPQAAGHGQSSNRSAKQVYRTEHGWTLRQILRNRTIYLIMLISVGYLMTLMFLLSHGVLHLLDNGVSRLEAASILGLIILGSGIGRLPAGWLGDRFELRSLFVVSLALMLTAFLLFWKTQDLILLSAVALVFGACYGGLLVLFPAMQGNYFGEQAFPTVNSLLAPLMLPFGAAAPAGAGYIFESQGSYDLAFGAGAILLGIAVIVALFLVPPNTPSDTRPS